MTLPTASPVLDSTSRGQIAAGSTGAQADSGSRRWAARADADFVDAGVHRHDHRPVVPAGMIMSCVSDSASVVILLCLSLSCPSFLR